MIALLLFSLLLQTAQIEIKGHILNVEIADTQEAYERGLSGREALPDNSGMLFVYKEEKPLSFWMKETKIPLSIGFFNEDQTLLNIQDMRPPEKNSSSFPVFCSKSPAKYALEVPLGWFQKRGVLPGEKFYFINPKEPQ